MPRYFLDTSALAKLYRSEAGSAFVDRIFSEPASQHLISRLTIVEMESVFALKARTGQIDQQAVLIARRRLEADLGRSRLLVAAVNDDHFRSATRLLISTALPKPSVRSMRYNSRLLSGSSERDL